MRGPGGIRIRRRRLALGLSQAALAREVGISPSYLNLIENNKREVGGALLLRIAARLELKAEELSGDDEQESLRIIREMFADPLLQGLDVAQTDIRDLVARFPEVAQGLLRMHRAYSDATAGVEAYASRLHSDPMLAQMLHEVLNRITGMRSIAEIITGVEDLDEANRRRFAGAINREAREVTESVRRLATYFDQAAVQRRSISPIREVEDAIIAANNHFPTLEEAADRLRADIGDEFSEPALIAFLHEHAGITVRRRSGPGVGGAPVLTRQSSFDAETRVLWFRGSTTQATRQFQLCRLIAEEVFPEVLDTVAAELPLTTTEARAIARAALASYVAGAMVMPYGRFLQEAQAREHDIDLLSHIFNASFEQVAHRLVTLRRKGSEGVPFGFLRADQAGRLTKRFPLPGLSLPGAGHGCLLWPIYTAAGTPGVVRQVVEFPSGARFLLVAKSVPKRVSTWHEQPLVFSIMLACDIHHADRTVYARGLDLQDPHIAVPVGPSCLVCIREDCGHRQEVAPVVLG